MTYLKILVYSFACSRQGCRELAEDVVAVDLREARRELLRQGWAIRERREYCPEHAS